MNQVCECGRGICEPTETCGCICHKAGTAVLVYNAGVVTVTHADPLIRVAVESDLVAGVIEPDGVLCLDTARQYRYRFVHAENEHTHIYERITEDQP